MKSVHFWSESKHTATNYFMSNIIFESRFEACEMKKKKMKT